MLFDQASAGIVDECSDDAIALAVRVNAPLFVAEEVMDTASIVPEQSLDDVEEEGVPAPVSAEEEEQLAAFRDFIDELDLDDLGKN